MLALHHMEKPVTAMANGMAAGAGFDIACALNMPVPQGELEATTMEMAQKSPPGRPSPCAFPN